MTGGGERSRCRFEARPTRDVVVRILDFLYALPGPSQAYCWPVAIRPDGKFAVKESHFDGGNIVRGYWSSDGEEFLCVDQLVVDNHTPRGKLSCWFDRTRDGKISACSVSLESVRRLLMARPTDLERKKAIRADPIGDDFGENGKRFVFRPKGSSIDRALAARYSHSVDFKHRIFDFVQQSPKSAYWLTPKRKDQLLLLEKDQQQDRLLDDVDIALAEAATPERNARHHQREEHEISSSEEDDDDENIVTLAIVHHAAPVSTRKKSRRTSRRHLESSSPLPTTLPAA